jgi:hypothetical protein
MVAVPKSLPMDFINDLWMQLPGADFPLDAVVVGIQPQGIGHLFQLCGMLKQKVVIKLMISEDYDWHGSRLYVAVRRTVIVTVV